jgi:hypothetical protein
MLRRHSIGISAGDGVSKSVLDSLVFMLYGVESVSSRTSQGLKITRVGIFLVLSVVIK